MLPARSDPEVIVRYEARGVDHDNRGFYEGWLKHSLRLNRCSQCGRWHHPPRPICPDCWSSDVVPTEVSGRGQVALAVLLRQGPELDGVTYPYPVVGVELDEQQGLRVSSTVVGCPPEEVAIGMSVALRWTERGGAPVPVFEPLWSGGPGGR